MLVVSPKLKPKSFNVKNAIDAAPSCSKKLNKKERLKPKGRVAKRFMHFELCATVFIVL